jgi:hypothetical protein
MLLAPIGVFPIEHSLSTPAEVPGANLPEALSNSPSSSRTFRSLGFGLLASFFPPPLYDFLPPVVLGPVKAYSLDWSEVKREGASQQGLW